MKHPEDLSSLTLRCLRPIGPGCLDQDDRILLGGQCAVNWTLQRLNLDPFGIPLSQSTSRACERCGNDRPVVADFVRAKRGILATGVGLLGKPLVVRAAWMISTRPGPGQGYPGDTIACITS